MVQTDLKQIQNAVEKLSLKIKENESFRITVEKRFNTISSKDIIEACAADLKRKVDLSKPDKILLIEVVGGLTGLSVIRGDGILSVLKEKVL